MKNPYNIARLRDGRFIVYNRTIGALDQQVFNTLNEAQQAFKEKVKRFMEITHKQIK